VLLLDSYKTRSFEIEHCDLLAIAKKQLHRQLLNSVPSTMAVCDCSDSHESENCILMAVDQWSPTWSVACIYCYDGISLEYGDACSNRSIYNVKDEVLETLAFFDTYNLLYNILVEMHPD